MKNSTRYIKFNKFFNSNGLIDVGHLGASFGWHNKRKPTNVVFARLNRALANVHWLKLYRSAIYVTIIGSNHAPVLLDISYLNASHRHI